MKTVTISRFCYGSFLLLMLTGCATPAKMALIDDSDAIGTSGKPMFLMSVTLKNEYKPSYQPSLFAVQIERDGGQSKSDRFTFFMGDDDKGRNETEAGNNYLLRMELDPGTYTIRAMMGQGNLFPNGFFFAPLHLDLTVSGAGVYYLGHVDAIVRKRQEGDFPAGPLNPIIDQAVTGFYTGTFDVVVSDSLDKDEPEFRRRFRALKEHEIKRAVLPPFDRGKVEQWWVEGRCTYTSGGGGIPEVWCFKK